jgi:hypothetical protein
MEIYNPKISTTPDMNLQIVFRDFFCNYQKKYPLIFL